MEDKVVSVPTEGGSDLAEAAVWELHGVSRRSFIRTGLAVGGGLVAAMYVKPAFQTIGIPRAFAAVSPAPGGSCTPGFWKNHESEWPSPYTTTTVYASVFSVPAAYSASLGSGKSFETVVAQGGGCEKSLGRHSVAALLSAILYATMPRLVQSISRFMNA